MWICMQSIPEHVPRQSWGNSATILNDQSQIVWATSGRLRKELEMMLDRKYESRMPIHFWFIMPSSWYWHHIFDFHKQKAFIQKLEGGIWMQKWACIIQFWREIRAHVCMYVGPEQSLVKAEKSHSINNRQVTLCAPNIKQSNIQILWMDYKN